MSGPARQDPPDPTRRPADCPPDARHPQAQAAQSPGGGGAPGTGEEEKPTEAVNLRDVPPPQRG